MARRADYRDDAGDERNAEVRQFVGEPPVGKVDDSNICRIFVSRKTSDSEILGQATEDREKLVALAPDRLVFFDAELIEPGEPWREIIRKEIKRADILLLVLTGPARQDFDWPLYEAGLFDNKKEEGRLICIYPEGGHPPDQLKDLQGVEATLSNLFDMLESLFTDPNFSNTRTPLNRKFHTYAGAMEEIAEATYKRINGFSGSGAPCDVKYINPYIQLILPRGAEELNEATPIESNSETLGTLFKLSENPSSDAGSLWTWGHIKEASAHLGRDMGLNTCWTREVEVGVRFLMDGRVGDEVRIISRFIANDNKVWEPGIEISRKYPDGKTIVDVTFSPEARDAWLQRAEAPVALAANLGVATRIRHDLLETYPHRVATWDDGEGDGYDELAQLVHTIEHDGFLIRWLTQNKYADVFKGDPELAQEMKKLEVDFMENIRPRLQEALTAKKAKDVSEALGLWRVNNTKFLSLGIPQYEKSLQLDLPS